MIAYQQGDALAFDTLYKRHSGKVYGYLKTRLGERAAVDDVFQATFLNFHRARSKYDASLPFLPWLFTICRNALLDRFRKTGREREILKYSDSEVIEAAPDGEVSTLAEELPAEIAALPLSQRQALELRFREDLEFGEIAKHLNTSPANARQLVSRAVRKLQALMNAGRRVK